MNAVLQRTGATLTGTISQVVVELDLMRRGLNVLRPTMTTRYDLAVEVAPERLCRIQVKTGTLKRSGDLYVTCGKKPYNKDEIDVIAVFDPVNERIYYVPIERIPATAQGFDIRLTPRRYKRLKGAAIDAERYLTFPNVLDGVDGE